MVNTNQFNVERDPNVLLEKFQWNNTFVGKKMKKEEEKEEEEEETKKGRNRWLTVVITSKYLLKC